jgi:hypothetical protein
MGVVMPAPSPGRPRRREKEVALANPLNPAKVLGGAFDLSPMTGEDHDLQADVALQMDVARRPDVLAPTVLGRGQTTLDVGGPVVVQHHHRPNRIRIGVVEGLGRGRPTD